MVATIEHLIGTPSRHDFGLIPVFPDQKVGCPPDIYVQNHGEAYERKERVSI
jgi:hypothetical protein